MAKSKLNATATDAVEVKEAIEEPKMEEQPQAQPQQEPQPQPQQPQAPAVPQPVPTEIAHNTIFGEVQNFAEAKNKAIALTNSFFVPENYQAQKVGQVQAVANCLVAMDMAMNMKLPLMIVMQNLYLVHGTPAWKATFLIGAFNNIKRYNGVHYRDNFKEAKKFEEMWCMAYTIDTTTGEELDGVKIDYQLVHGEGYDMKNGSKWKTMPQQMFRYRAAVFMIRAYAPEITYGIYEGSEVEDFKAPVNANTNNEMDNLNNKL